MLREGAGGEVLDVRTVEQRFDLRGEQQVSVPLALDLEAGTLHWLDTVPRAKALGAVVGHQVAAYTDELGLAARTVLESAALGARPTLWDLAELHARARTDAIWTRDTRGELRDETGAVQATLPDGPTFGAFLFRDLALPPGSLAASLREQVVDGLQSVPFESLMDELALPQGHSREP